MKNYSIFIFLIVLGLWNCAENNADCADCGGGLLEGYLYKEVTLEDVGKLAEIAVNTEIGACIRYRMDGADFTEAIVMDECFCTRFQ